MTIKSDASTGTCSGKLSATNDEAYAYAEITERLMTALSNAGGKNPVLPMRRSLFAHVPPCIVFQASRNNRKSRKNESNARLPVVIRRHLLWWHNKGLLYSSGVVRSTVQKSGFTVTTNFKVNWSGTTCGKLATQIVGSARNFRKINRLPESSQLSNKISLWKNFRRMRAKFGYEDFDFMPESFVLPEEADSFNKFARRNDGIWIIKPPASCCGRGIKIVSRYRQVPRRGPSIVQRYVSKPRLVNGVKFDIRLYVLITSVDPLRIYLYREGLVRLATVEYSNNVDTLPNRFMHLTNTTVNRKSPNFRSNDDPDECKGNMWSLSSLWKYLKTSGDTNTRKIWNDIKSIVIKIVISAESSLVDAWRRVSSTSTYSFYQLFGFDVLLDENYRVWLLEVNDSPSLNVDTPLCKIVKGQLAEDYLNLVGFHVPDILSREELKILVKMYGENELCYNQRLYSGALTQEEKMRQDTFSEMVGRDDYSGKILAGLTASDTRVLIRHEDELARTGRFEMIFPTCDTYQYFKFFDRIRYYNALLDAWESEYRDGKSEGVDRLRKLCERKYHLS